jgi:hypothetical protein
MEFLAGGRESRREFEYKKTISTLPGGNGNAPDLGWSSRKSSGKSVF